MIDYPRALAVCRADPEAAARMICALFHELDLLKAEVATLKAENAALRNECQLLRAECQSLREENQTLRAEVRELKEKASKNSHNSSKPPSSDGLSKPKPKNLRQPGKRPTGGQPGHPGHTPRMVDKPDHTVRHLVERCADCGCSLANQAPNRIERRQVFDLPEPRLEVTEHQAVACLEVGRPTAIGSRLPDRLVRHSQSSSTI